MICAIRIALAALALQGLAAGQAPLERIAFGSCLNATEHAVLNLAAELPSDLFIFLGDNIYADTTDMAVMRAKYAALKGSGFFQALRAKGPIMATWDDHDMGQNDGGADYPMRRESQREFLNWLDVPAESPRRAREGIYEARVFGPPGRRVQVIALDTRYFRSPLKRRAQKEAWAGGTAVPDDDPAKTVLGAEQWRWLRETLAVPAELRLIASSIQFAAEASGSESWANFPRERRRMVEVIRESKANSVIFLSGDRHWCELSCLTEDVPYPLYDLTASSMTHAHARGTPTPNANRAHPKTYHQPNVGTMDIQWAGDETVITLRILDETGLPRMQKELRLGELRG